MLSVRAKVKLGAVVSFENDLSKITRNSKLLAVGVIREKLYILKIMEDQVNIASEELESDLFLWHCRLGHLGMDNVIKLANGNMVKGLVTVNHFVKVVLWESSIVAHIQKVSRIVLKDHLN